MIETRRLKKIVIFIQTIFTVTILSKKYKCMFYQDYWKRFYQKLELVY